MKKMLFGLTGFSIVSCLLPAISGHWLWTGQMSFTRNVAPSPFDMTLEKKCVYFTGFSFQSIESEIEIESSDRVNDHLGCAFFVKA